MHYASSLVRNPADTYRQVDLVGRTAQAGDGAGLVTLLYDELLAALRVAAIAAERGEARLKSEKVTRATAILFALEAGLDFDKGGSVSQALADLYAGARRQVIAASIGNDPAPFRAAAENLAEIADAWRQVRAA
ncbi:flagellar export chaperone FliS [Sphingomonas aracearum]|uniref:flagellar export chaperone FliS n=1 Tax=Sphingomonas aracearum TaxID=2283317 RepID=UPI0015F0EE34